MENGWEKQKETRQEAVRAILARDGGARSGRRKVRMDRCLELRDP